MAWLVVSLAGLTALHRYDSSPGTSGPAVNVWPGDATGILLDSTVPTLLFFAHPRCPCTVASIDQLRALLEQQPRAVRAYALFVVPPGAGAGWTTSPIWDAARSTNGLMLLADPLGTQATRFGATTSGLTLVYGPDGALRYRGGLTVGRGIAAPGDGQEDLLRALTTDDHAPLPEHQVFGCPLFNNITAEIRADEQQ